MSSKAKKSTIFGRPIGKKAAYADLGDPTQWKAQWRALAEMNLRPYAMKASAKSEPVLVASLGHEKGRRRRKPRKHAKRKS